MKIEFDQAKSDKNLHERQLSFERARDFDWSSAVIASDLRNEYPEARYIAVGYLDNRLPVLCFTPANDAIRVISFRKANRREAERHGKPLTID
jgi:uncharacterized DUF497 family protein